MNGNEWTVSQQMTEFMLNNDKCLNFSLLLLIPVLLNLIWQREDSIRQSKAFTIVLRASWQRQPAKIEWWTLYLIRKMWRFHKLSSTQPCRFSLSRYWAFCSISLAQKNTDSIGSRRIYWRRHARIKSLAKGNVTQMDFICVAVLCDIQVILFSWANFVVKRLFWLLAAVFRTMLIQSIRAVCVRRTGVRCRWAKHFGCRVAIAHRQHTAMRLPALQQVCYLFTSRRWITNAIVCTKLIFIFVRIFVTPMNQMNRHRPHQRHQRVVIRRWPYRWVQPIPYRLHVAKITLSWQWVPPDQKSLPCIPSWITPKSTHHYTIRYHYKCFHYYVTNGDSLSDWCRCQWFVWQRVKYNAIVISDDIETESIDTGTYAWRSQCNNQLRSECRHIDCTIDWSKYLSCVYWLDTWQQTHETNLRDEHEKKIFFFRFQANDLQPRDFSGTADPYAKIRLLPDKANFWQTKIHKRTLNPSKRHA